MNDEVRIVIVGAQTPIGAEVARLAVSMGFEVIGLTRREVDQVDPWQQGVVWKPFDALDSEVLAATAVVWAMNYDLGEGVVIPDRARQVYLGTGTPLGVLSSNAVWLVSEGDPSLPLEQRAIAVLRAAVEDEHRGILTREEVAHLGDAMMLQ